MYIQQQHQSKNISLVDQVDKLVSIFILRRKKNQIFQLSKNKKKNILFNKKNLTNVTMQINPIDENEINLKSNYFVK